MALQRGEDLAGGDAVKPDGEGRGVAQLGAPLERAYERLLGAVLGLVRGQAAQCGEPDGLGKVDLEEGAYGDLLAPLPPGDDCPFPGVGIPCIHRSSILSLCSTLPRLCAGRRESQHRTKDGWMRRNVTSRARGLDWDAS